MSYPAEREPGTVSKFFNSTTTLAAATTLLLSGAALKSLDMDPVPKAGAVPANPLQSATPNGHMPARELGGCKQIATPTEVKFCENNPLDRRMCWFRTPLYNTSKWFCIAFDEDWSEGKFRRGAKSISKPLVTIEDWRIDEAQRDNVIQGRIDPKSLNRCYEDTQKMDRQRSGVRIRWVIFIVDNKSCGYKFQKQRRKNDPKSWYYPNSTVRFLG